MSSIHRRHRRATSLDTDDASELFADTGAADLRHRASRIRRIALPALMVSSELEFVAGQLMALAAIRAVMGERT
jgi:hypothetical protein